MGEEVMGGWQPIETAPKDGTRVLIWPGRIRLGVGDETITMEFNEGPLTAKWDSYWLWHASPNEATENDFDMYEPTHWMPLPKPPIESA